MELDNFEIEKNADTHNNTQFATTHVVVSAEVEAEPKTVEQ